MVQAAQYFREDYRQARQAFIEACKSQNLQIETARHPLRGPDGEELAIDWTRIGSAEPKKLLVLTSGVHGPELMTGSGCQVGHISQGAFSEFKDSTDVAILIIHAANPWGSAYLRRNNEDNVDLCRNFVDFDQPIERNHDYDRIKDLLPDAFAAGAKGDQARQAIEEYKKQYGPESFGRGFMAGQYHDPSGMSFGGLGPVWSNQILTREISRYVPFTEDACLLDYHSGLGPYAYCTAVCLQTGEALAQVRSVFGPWILAPRDPSVQGDGKAPDVSGHTTEMHERVFAPKKPLSVVLEFGVEAYDHTADILMQEHKAYNGDREIDAAEVKQKLLRSFYPKDPYWRQSIFNHSKIAVEQALDYLVRGKRAYGGSAQMGKE